MEKLTSHPSFCVCPREEKLKIKSTTTVVASTQLAGAGVVGGGLLQRKCRARSMICSVRAKMFILSLRDHKKGVVLEFILIHCKYE